MRKLIGNCLIAAIVAGGVAAAGCTKSTPTTVYDARAQYKTDSVLIQQYLLANNLTGSTKELVQDGNRTGIYYQVLAPGRGAVNMGFNTSVYVRMDYSVQLLNGGLVDKGLLPLDTVKKAGVDTLGTYYDLGSLIPAFQLAVRQIQPGGEVRFITPSYYAYQQRSSATPRPADGSTTFVPLPANAVLDCRVKLLKATNR